MRTEGISLAERDQETDAIDVAVERCQDGNGQLLVFEGAPGLGKSHLLEFLRHRTQERGFRVLRARGSEFESAFPYGVVRQLFEGWLKSASPQERRTVFRGPAKLAEPLFDYGAEAVPAAGDGQHTLVYGLYWMCLHIAESGPLALLLDDLCRADPESLRFLNYLAARHEDRPVLLALAFDPGERTEQTDITRAIVSGPVARLLRLAPLSETGVRQCLQEALGDEPDPRLAAACHHATGGIPFFVRELIDEIAATGPHTTGLSPEQVHDMAPPKAVRSVVRRLGGLRPSAVALVEAMAVLGTDADLRHAIDVAGLDQRSAAEALGELVDARLLHPDVPPRFGYSVIRTAIYHNLPAGERGDLHARAASVLTACAAPDADIADHLVRAPAAGDKAALDTLRKAAHRAAEDGRDPAAVSYLARALREPSPPHETVDLLLELGRAERRARMPEALDHLFQAMNLCRNPAQRARIGLDLIGALALEARGEEALALLKDLRGQADPHDAELRKLLDIAMLLTQRQTFRLDPIVGPQLTSLEERAGGDPDLLRLLAAERAAEAMRNQAPVDQVLALAEPVLKDALADGIVLHTHDITVHTWCLTGIVLAWCGRLSDADHLLTLVVEETQKHGLALATDITLSLRGWIRFQCGRLDEAEADARKVLGHAGDAGLRGAFTTFALAALSDVLTARHELAAAQAVLRRYDHNDAVKRSRMYAPVLFAHGRLRTALGETDAGLEDFLRGCRRMDDSGMQYPTLLYASEAAVALIRADRTHEAQARVGGLVTRAKAFGAPRVIAAALRAAGLSTPGAAGIDLLEESADILAGTEARLEYATALIDLGAALRRGDRPAQARRRLTAGLEVALSCGAWGPVRTARSELAAMGVRVRATEATGADSLTSQERRVAELAAEGKRNRDIAHTLFVTLKTVEWHLNRAYRKLGITSRDELPGALPPQEDRGNQPAPQDATGPGALPAPVLIEAG